MPKKSTATTTIRAPGAGRKLYLAYGSNLHHASMRIRCPNARPVGTLMLANSLLQFRGVADVECVPDKTCITPVGVWSITREDERSLDVYEGVRGGFYDRYHIDVGDTKALLYLMRDRGIAPPGREYYNVIRRGYADFGLDIRYLEAALARSYEEKNVTSAIRARRERNPKRHGNVMPSVKEAKS